MKKICISFIIILLIFSTQVLAANEYDLGSTKKFEITQIILEQLLEKYKTEDVKEEERIIDYRWEGLGGGVPDEQGITKLTINFTVIPYLEENSEWKKDFRYIAFAQVSVENKEYKIDKISLEPENYDKFLEKFEEYQKSQPEIVEVQAVSAEKTEELKTNKIEKMSNVIFISSGSVFIVLIIGIVVNVVKNKKLNWGI